MDVRAELTAFLMSRRAPAPAGDRRRAAPRRTPPRADLRRCRAELRVADRSRVTCRLRHPDLGDIVVAVDVMRPGGEPGRRVVTLTTEPGPPSPAALRRLVTPPAAATAGAGTCRVTRAAGPADMVTGGGAGGG